MSEGSSLPPPPTPSLSPPPLAKKRRRAPHTAHSPTLGFFTAEEGGGGLKKVDGASEEEGEIREHILGNGGSPQSPYTARRRLDPTAGSVRSGRGEIPGGRPSLK